MTKPSMPQHSRISSTKQNSRRGCRKTSFREVQNGIESLVAWALVQNLIGVLVLNDKTRSVKNERAMIIFRKLID